MFHLPTCRSTSVDSGKGFADGDTLQKGGPNDTGNFKRHVEKMISIVLIIP